MNTLGAITKTKIFKTPESMGLTEKFEADGVSNTLTLSTAAITGNVISGYVGGTLVTVTYATSAAATLTALAVAIAAVPGVKSATVTTATTVITVVPNDQSNPIALVGWAETGGSSQGTITIALVDNRVQIGMPVMLLSTGKVAPCDPANVATKCIGYSINPGVLLDADNKTVRPEDVTILLKSDMIIYAECAASSQAIGPVGIYVTTPYNSTTGYNIVDDASITVTNMIGWAMDAGTNAGDVVRVILKK